MIWPWAAGTVVTLHVIFVILFVRYDLSLRRAVTEEFRAHSEFYRFQIEALRSELRDKHSLREDE